MMEFFTDRDEFLRGLREAEDHFDDDVDRATVVLRADANGGAVHLEPAATGVAYQVNSAVELPGACRVRLLMLRRLVHAMPDETVHVAQVGERLRLRSGMVEATMPVGLSS